MLLEIIAVAGPALMFGAWAASKGLKEAALKGDKKINFTPVEYSLSNKYSPALLLVKELVESEPEKWTVSGATFNRAYSHDEAGIRMRRNQARSYRSDVMERISLSIRDTKDFVTYELNSDDQQLVKQLQKTLEKHEVERAKRQLEDEKDQIAKALANRLLQRQQGVLAQPRLEDSRRTTGCPLESFTTETSNGYVVYHNGQVIETVPGNSRKLARSLAERYAVA